MTDRPLIWDASVADCSKWDDHFKRPDLPPGAAWWGRDDDGRVMRIQYVCPCGCSDWRQVSVSVAKPPPAHHWAWDGNEDRPTLNPSILHIVNKPGDCGWHGYLTEGVWRTV